MKFRETASAAVKENKLRDPFANFAFSAVNTQLNFLSDILNNNPTKSPKIDIPRAL